MVLQPSFLPMLYHGPLRIQTHKVPFSFLWVSVCNLCNIIEIELKFSTICFKDRSLVEELNNSFMVYNQKQNANVSA